VGSTSNRKGVKQLETTITLTEKEFCKVWANAVMEYLNRGTDDLFVTKDLVKMGSIMAELLFNTERV